MVKGSFIIPIQIYNFTVHIIFNGLQLGNWFIFNWFIFDLAIIIRDDAIFTEQRSPKGLWRDPIKAFLVALIMLFLFFYQYSLG